MDNKNQYSIVFVPIEKLKISKINPPNRTTDASIKELKISIQEKGFSPMHPILISKDGFIGDGHRRYQAAKLIGIKDVPVIYTDKSVEELMQLNQGAKTWGTVETLCVYATSNIQCISSSFDSQIGSVEKFFGKELIAMVANQGFSSRVLLQTRSLVNYVGKGDDKQFIRKSLMWMMDHNQVRACIDAKRDGISAKTLINAIEQNRPLHRGSWS